jgi:PIN domain nuclease of toxin-antitoxin system
MMAASCSTNGQPRFYDVACRRSCAFWPLGASSHHWDPMDRPLIAQAMVEDMTIVTTDSVFARYSAKTMW